jgi:hypothetical protein
MFSLESTSVYSTEFDTPQANRFATDSDASLGEQIFDEWSGIPAMAEIEAAVQLDCIADDVRRESVTLISIFLYVLIRRFKQFFPVKLSLPFNLPVPLSIFTHRL